MIFLRLLLLAGLVSLPALGSTSRLAVEHEDNGLNVGDHFASAVAIDQDLAVAGVPDDDVNLLEDAGHVEVFTRGLDGRWGDEPVLIFPPENHSGGRFGASVLIQNGTLLVGEPGTAGGGTVHVYEQDSESQWVRVATLSTNETTLGDGFGTALAMEGNTIFIGAPFSTGGGAVYVFVRDVDSWTRDQKVVSNDIDDGDHFGAAIAMHNGLLAVGAPGREDESGTLVNNGAVYTFLLESGLWLQTEIATPQVSDQRSEARFGAAVSLQDQKLLVGAPKEDLAPYESDHGAAYVLGYDGFDWLQEARLQMPDASDWQPGSFGTTVRLDGNRLLVGAPKVTFTNGPAEAGAVVAFTYDPVDGWLPGHVFQDVPGRKEVTLGSALALDGSDLLLGAPHDRRLGSARFYQYNDDLDEWSEVNAIYRPTADGGPDKYLGYSVAVSHGLTVAAQPKDVTWGRQLIGSVYVYDHGRGSLVTKLLPPAWAKMPGEDYFDVLQNYGTAVAADQDLIAVTSSAGVFVYRVTGGPTVQLEALLEVPASSFTPPFSPDLTVAISGSTILVGNPYEVFNDKELGAVHVFVKEGSAWRRQAVLRGTQDRGAFGLGFALAGDTAVIGAPALAPSNATFSAAYVFTRSGTTWTQRRQLTSPVAQVDYFGQFIALEGPTLAVSVPGNENGGRILLYEGAGSAWTLKQTLTGDLRDTHLGTSLALDSGRLLTGLNGPGFFYGGAATFSQREGLWKRQESFSPEVGDATVQGFGQFAAIDQALITLGSPYESAQAGAGAGALALIDSPGTLELYDGATASAPRIGGDGAAVVRLDSEPVGLVQGVTLQRLITIYNASSSVMENLEVSVDGPSAGDFAISPPLLTTLLPGEKTTFQLTVIPSPGSIEADLHVGAYGQATIDVALEGTVLATPQVLAFVEQPRPDTLLKAGGTLLLRAPITAPPGTLRFTWKKNGRPVPGAADSAELLIPHVVLADAGVYTVDVQFTPAGVGAGALMTSDPANVVVVGQAPAGVRWMSRGSALSLTLPIAGPGYQVAWQGSFGPLQDGAPFSGTQTPTMRVSRLREQDFQGYTPVVSLGNEPPLWQGSVTINEVLRSGPTFFYSDLGTWMVGQAGTVALNLDSPPSPGFTFTATGLPPGLRLNSRTGVLSGTPTKEGLYQVRVVVSNRFGRTAQTIPVQVYPFNGGDQIAGAYQGLLNRDPTLNDNLGGSVKINLTRNGVCTGRITFGPIITSFVCQLDLYYQGKVTLRSPDRRWEYDLRLVLDTFTNRFTGTITHDYTRFTATDFVAQRAETIEHLSGYYTGLLTPVEPQATDDTYPQGAAFNTARVGDDGSVVLAGRLADGAVITASTFSGYFGEAPVHVLLYGGTGSLQGTLLIQRTTEFFENDYNLLRGTFSWLKKPSTSVKETSYAAGIPLHDLNVLSFRYFPPVEGSIVLALDPQDDNAQITFEDAGVEDSNMVPDSILTIDSSHQVLPPAVNETALALTLDPATGIFTGAFTLKDIDPLSPLKTVSRKASFTGVLIPRLDAGFGNFQLPQLRTVPNKLPPTLSGNLVLERPRVE